MLSGMHKNTCGRCQLLSNILKCCNEIFATLLFHFDFWVVFEFSRLIILHQWHGLISFFTLGQSTSVQILYFWSPQHLKGATFYFKGKQPPFPVCITCFSFTTTWGVVCKLQMFTTLKDSGWDWVTSSGEFTGCRKNKFPLSLQVSR